MGWPTGKWRNIKKNEVVFVGLITSSYMPKTSGPLFTAPMSTSMTMLPDVQSAEKCWKITASSSQDYSCPVRSDIVNCGTPSSSIIKKLLPGRVQKQADSADCNSSNAEMTAQYTGKCHHIDWSAVIISIPQQCSNKFHNYNRKDILLKAESIESQIQTSESSS